MTDLSTNIAPKNVNELKAYATAIAGSGMFGHSKPEAVFTILATGVELGFSPVQSMLAIHVIKGKPSLAASAMMALVLRSDFCDYFEIDETSDERCIVVAKRTTGRKKEVVFQFTIKDAKRAGLSGGNWSKFPAAMLRARAISGCARQVFPDVLLGFYTPGELGDVEVIDPTSQEYEAADEIIEDAVFEPAPEPKKEKVLTVENERKYLRATIGVFSKAKQADIMAAVKWRYEIESFSDEKAALINQGQLKSVNKITKYFAESSDESVLDERVNALLDKWKEAQAELLHKQQIDARNALLSEAAKHLENEIQEVAFVEAVQAGRNMDSIPKQEFLDITVALWAAEDPKKFCINIMNKWEASQVAA